MPAPELPFETASWARRVLALLVDYAACWGVMLLIYGGDWFGNGTLPSVYLNLVFIGESALLMALSGGSFGQLATRAFRQMLRLPPGALRRCRRPISR